MSNYLSFAFASWLTPIYLVILAVITAGVITNILKEEKIPLHDIVEDISDFTLDDLRALGFSNDIVEIVRIVTKDKTRKKSYHDWITEIIETNNLDAVKVKYADIMDHLNLERLNRLDEEKRCYFVKKYQEEALRLEKVLITT